MQGRGGNDQARLRKGVPDATSVVDELPPAQHDILRDGRTLTCCGPRSRASRTSSLNRAFASWRRQRPGCSPERRDDPLPDFPELVMPTR